MVVDPNEVRGSLDFIFVKPKALELRYRNT
jgi:hypothetical protein